jgi:ribosomal protein S17
MLLPLRFSSSLFLQVSATSPSLSSSIMKMPIVRPSSVNAIALGTTAQSSAGRAAFSYSSASSSSAKTSEHRPSSPQSSPPLSSSIPPASVDASLPSLSSIRKYPYKVRTGTVISAGRMGRTVRVAHRHVTWDGYIRKWYAKVTTYMVSDPRNSLREGDVIEFSSGAPKSRCVHHVVERIVSPFSVPIEGRPSVMSREERDTERAQARAEKLRRREQRRSLASADQLNHSKFPHSEGDHVGRIRRLVLERLGEAELQPHRA